MLRADLRLYFLLHQIKGQRRQVKKKQCVQDRCTQDIISSLKSVIFCGRLCWLVASIFSSYLPSSNGERAFSPENIVLCWSLDSHHKGIQGSSFWGSAVRQRLRNRSPHPPFPPARRLTVIGGKRTSKGKNSGSVHLNKPGRKELQ